MIRCSSYCGQLVVSQEKVLVCTVHCDACSSLSCLTLVCVRACSCLGMCLSYVCNTCMDIHTRESLIFEGGAMVVMVPRQHFHFKNCECSAMQ